MLEVIRKERIYVFAIYDGTYPKKGYGGNWINRYKLYNVTREDDNKLLIPIWYSKCKGFGGRKFNKGDKIRFKVTLITYEDGTFTIERPMEIEKIDKE